MSNKKHSPNINKQIVGFFILMFIFNLLFVDFSQAAGLASRLKGRILLQVESKGEAWYVNPDNEKRYYLGRPADAFQIMRDLGLGISNKDFDSFKGYAPARLSGKILLKVEDNGKAYYVNPVDLKMYYLGRPADAFNLMRQLGLGITNSDLAKIEMINNDNTPTQVYLNYIKAINNNDIKTMESLGINRGDSKENTLSQEEEQQLLDFIKATLPLNISVINEIKENNKAILKVQGKTNPEMRQDSDIKNTLSYGIVALEKIDGQWKVYQSKWEDPVPIITLTDDDENVEYWDIRHFCNGLANENECENLEWQNTKSMCYSCFAQLKTDSSLCEKTTAGFDRENCFYQVAKLTGNKELCQQMTNSYNLKESCENYLVFSDFLTDTNIYT